MNLDETKKYGPSWRYDERWKRIVHQLDESFPAWRRDDDASRFIGDNSCRAIRHAAREYNTAIREREEMRRERDAARTTVNELQSELARAYTEILQLKKADSYVHRDVRDLERDALARELATMRRERDVARGDAVKANRQLVEMRGLRDKLRLELGNLRGQIRETAQELVDLSA